MTGWLRGLVGWGISGLKDLWNKALSVISTVYNYFVTLIDALDAELISIYHSLTNFIDAVETYASTLYALVRAWATEQLNSIISWAEKQLASVAKSISSIIAWASSLIDALRAYAVALVNDAKNWVIQNVYNPIVRSITDALKWITTDGYYAVQLLRNPPLLAKLLAKWLWGEWLSLIRQYSGVIGKWILHSMMGMASSVGSVIEDIIASIVD